MAAKGVKPVQVWIACPTRVVARKIGNELLRLGLGACAQTLGPIESRYLWKGKSETAREWLLLVKTHQARYDDLEKAVVGLHPYDVPEILATPIVRGHAAYLTWLADATPKQSTRRRPT